MTGFKKVEDWKLGFLEVSRLPYIVLNIEPSIEVEMAWGMSYLFDQNSSLQGDHKRVWIGCQLYIQFIKCRIPLISHVSSFSIYLSCLVRKVVAKDWAQPFSDKVLCC